MAVFDPIIVKGTSQWANVFEPNIKSKKYQIDICQLGKADVKQLEEEGSNIWEQIELEEKTIAGSSDGESSSGRMGDLGEASNVQRERGRLAGVAVRHEELPHGDALLGGAPPGGMGLPRDSPCVL